MVLIVSRAQKHLILVGKMTQLLWKGEAPKSITHQSRHFVSTDRKDRKKDFAKVLILDRKRIQLSDMTDYLARIAGHKSKGDLVGQWIKQHGSWDPQEAVDCITFILEGEKLKNGRWKFYKHRVFDASESPSTEKMFEE